MPSMRSESPFEDKARDSENERALSRAVMVGLSRGWSAPAPTWSVLLLLLLVVVFLLLFFSREMPLRFTVLVLDVRDFSLASDVKLDREDLLPLAEPSDWVIGVNLPTLISRGRSSSAEESPVRVRRW